jgi:sulfur-oxidizing protein SoxY
MAERVDRRRVLVRSAGFVAGAGILALRPSAPARATPQAMQEAIRAIAGDVAPQRGRITLDVPQLVENGNVVPLTV